MSLGTARWAPVMSLGTARRILLLSSVLYGLDYSLIKAAQEIIAPDIFSAVRHFAAVMFLLPLLPRCWHLLHSQPALARRSARIGNRLLDRHCRSVAGVRATDCTGG